MNLEEICTFSREAWTFDEKDYPSLTRLLLSEDRQAFMLRHILTHITKTLGQAASSLESLDHGQKLDVSELRTSLLQLIVEAVQFADVAGITPADLEREIRAWQVGRRHKVAA